MADKKLAGKVALITGASKGLGESMALALAEAGAAIAVVARDLPLLEKVAEKCRAHGVEAEGFQADITKDDDIAALERNLLGRFGKVDILINNAGINVRNSVTDLKPADWRRVIDTNLTSVFLMCHTFVPHMTGKGYGRIINMTSMMSWVSLPGRIVYSASKAGLLGLTRALALDLATEGVTVVGISPGPFATEMNKTLIANPEINAQFLSRIPLNRWGRVEEIGALAVYLCSEEAGFITGTDILIDGGWTAI